MKSSRIFHIFLFSLIILLFAPNLLKRGMFVDGLWYATISKNLAEGFGSFWSPAFTHTMYPVFNEHPPLVFGLQSLFFKVLGDACYVEKIYSLFTIFLTLIGINILWKTIFRDKPELKDYGFIPCILWILHEPVYLFYSNNMLECSQGIFILISVILILKGLKNSNKSSYLFIFLAGISLIFSFLSKGFTGLYPLITIIIYALIYKNISWRKMILYNGILWGSFCLIILFFLINNSAADNINNYIHTQVLAAILGERTEWMHTSRFYIIKRLLETTILPILLVTCLSLISFYKFGAKHFFLHKKEILFFLVLGLSGVLPMMVSKKQGSFYLLTVYPYISIVMSLILIRSESLLKQLKVSKTFRIISYSLLLFSLIFSSFSINKVNKRDQSILNDLDQLARVIPTHSTLGCVNNNNEVCLYGFFMRIHSVSLDTVNPYDYSLLLCDKEIQMDSTLYRAIDLQTEKFSLYEKFIID
jgi:4-amino-4-deoxy-L-arabinose transferase-like glycosyltransferase